MSMRSSSSLDSDLKRRQDLEMFAIPSYKPAEIHRLIKIFHDFLVGNFSDKRPALIRNVVWSVRDLIFKRKVIFKWLVNIAMGKKSEFQYDLQYNQIALTKVFLAIVLTLFDSNPHHNIDKITRHQLVRDTLIPIQESAIEELLNFNLLTRVNSQSLKEIPGYCDRVATLYTPTIHDAPSADEVGKFLHSLRFPLLQS
jgi:hypothetical protein